MNHYGSEVYGWIMLALGIGAICFTLELARSLSIF